jgi:hypothetical protein
MLICANVVGFNEHVLGVDVCGAHCDVHSEFGYVVEGFFALRTVLMTAVKAAVVVQLDRAQGFIL